MDQEVMLTTFDNPFNPFTQWDEWYSFDDARGYHTPGLLARICNFSLELSDSDRVEAINHAIDEIIEENVSGMHRKVNRQGEVVV